MKTYNKNKYTIIYLVATVVMICKLIFSYSTLINLPESIDNLISILYASLMLFKIWNQNYKKKHLFIFALIGMLFLYISLVTVDFYLVMSLLGFFAIKDVDINKVLKCMYTTKFIIIAIHIFVFLFDYVMGQAEVVYRFGSDIGRYSFNFNHPNVSSMLIVWAIFEYIYVNYNKIGKLQIILLWISYIPIYALNNSNTSLVVYSFVMMLIFLNRTNNIKITKFLNIFSRYGFLYSSLFSSLAVIFYLHPLFNSLLNVIDKLITGRIRLGAKVFSLYGHTYFGQYINIGSPIEWDTTYFADTIILDNFYIRSFLNYGIIVMLIISILLYKFALNLSEKDKIFMISMILYGINENYIINVFLCFPLLLVAVNIFQSSEPVLQVNEKKMDRKYKLLS